MFGDWLRSDLKESKELQELELKKSSVQSSTTSFGLHATLYKILENAISLNCKNAKKPKA